MKKYAFLVLAAMMMLATGCPVGLDYPLAKPGDEKADEDLIGTWTSQNSEAEVLSVKIALRDNNSLNVTVLERGSMYALETDNLTGWTTTLDKATFLFLKPEGEEKYYHYQYRYDGKDLVTNDVSLLIGGIDAVTSTETLRKEVSASMKESGWAEEKNTWSKE